MGQSDGYQIDGRKDAKEYYWTGAKGEKRAYGKAYADAHSKTDSDYMKNVAKGGSNYTQARMKDDADWEDVKQSTKKRVAGKSKAAGTAKKSASKKTTRKRVAGK